MRATVELPPDPATLTALLAGYARAARVLLARRPLPWLYDARVRYQREPRGRERWQLPHETFRVRVGDCEDLSIWRAGELQRAGVDAWPLVYRTGRRQLHVVVALPDGTIEDPSRVLGMGRR